MAEDQVHISEIAEYVEPQTPAPAPDPFHLLKQMVEEIMSPVIKKLDHLVDDNAKLHEEIASVKNHNFADGVPAHLRGSAHDPAINTGRMSAARSVTIATRPVRENPEEYKNVVDPGTVVRNSLSNPIKEEGEE